MPVGRTSCTLAKPGQVVRQWHHVDATDKVLGRLASRIAVVLMGKHKPVYTPHVDTGDFVVVTNAQNVKITGRKLDHRTYDRYTYYVGGHRSEPMRRLFDRMPERVIELAVRRMLPKNALGRRMLLKLKVYRGDSHPHAAQQPIPWSFDGDSES